MTEPDGRRTADGATFLALAAAVGALYGGSARFWWTADDPAILRHVFRYNPLQYLFVRDAYQGFSKLFFFPGLLLSFDADLRIFGFRPVFFYLHQLAACALAAGLFFVLLRRWISRPAAFFAALLFLVGPPLSRVVPQLGVRHYIDGLAFALGAILCFLTSVERKSRAFGIAAGALALAAMTCKEIYVPLPLLLLALPEDTLHERFRRAVPVFGAAALYAGWRSLLLGVYVGGYSGASSTPGALLARVPALAAGLVNELGGVRGDFAFRLAVAAACVAGACIGGAFFLRRKSPGFFILVALLVLAPLLPVSDNFQARYAFLPWLAFAAAAGWTANVCWSRGAGGARVLAFAVAALLVVAALLANRREWRSIAEAAKRSKAEAQFFFHDSAPGDVLRLPAEEGNYYTWLGWLRTEALHFGVPGRAVFDDLYFCRPAGPVKRAFSFSNASNRVVEVEGGGPGICASYLRRIREAAPLSVRIDADDGVFAWEFGPEAAGRWAILMGDDLVRYDLPRAGRHKPVFLPQQNSVTVRYESPEGWLAFSPALPFVMRDGRTRIAWKR